MNDFVGDPPIAADVGTVWDYTGLTRKTSWGDYSVGVPEKVPKMEPRIVKNARFTLSHLVPEG